LPASHAASCRCFGPLRTFLRVRGNRCKIVGRMCVRRHCHAQRKRE
jgi:hypothetical protein